MQIIFFSANLNKIEEWKKREKNFKYLSCHDLESLQNYINQIQNYIIVADYDSVAPLVNKLITSAEPVNNLIVLENSPELITGKMLISKGIKAYGNARMLKIHYDQMIKAVKDTKVWTYPELTAYLIKTRAESSLSPEAKKIIETRLTEKEKETLYLVLNGFTNSAIAEKLSITQRTVKAHISSIFTKLHVNDRLALVLLLK